MDDLIRTPTRRSRLEAWLKEYRVSKKQLASRMGVSYHRLLQLLAGLYLKQVQRDKLVALGIPSELLPEATDVQDLFQAGRSEAQVQGPGTGQLHD